MKWTSFILTLFFTTSVAAQNCCDFKLDKRISIKRIGQEYQRLRNYKNQDCCERYGSGLMKIMGMLSDSLDLGVSEKRIIEIMGDPDMYASKEHPVEHHFVQLKEDEKVLIYFWRGMHDFLYLGIKDSKLIYKDWYYAME